MKHPDDAGETASAEPAEHFLSAVWKHHHPCRDSRDQWSDIAAGREKRGMHAVLRPRGNRSHRTRRNVREPVTGVRLRHALVMPGRARPFLGHAGAGYGWLGGTIRARTPSDWAIGLPYHPDNHETSPWPSLREILRSSSNKPMRRRRTARPRRRG